MSGEENPKPVNIDPKCIQDALRVFFQPIKNDDPQIDFYTMYKREATEYDAEYMQNYNEDLNTTLIFAGLFSAVSSAFVIDIQSKLEPDPAERSEAYLRAIILSINPSILPGEKPAAPADWNGPPQEIVTTLDFLYASLLLSLFAAFVAMLGKQWLNRYRRHAGGSTIERCGDRQRKFDGLEKWSFRFFIESLPFMLQIALVLLACGLSRYMWSVNKSVARLLTSFTALGFIFYIGILIAGISSYECPFQTPASIALRHLRDSETTRRFLAKASPVNIISLARRNALKFLARLSLPSVTSLVYATWMDSHQGLVSASHHAYEAIRRPSSWEFSLAHILSGIHHAATRVGHQTIILLLRIDRAFGNTKYRVVQGIRKFRRAGLLPTSTRDVGHQPQPLVPHNIQGLRLRVRNLEGIRRQNAANARCASWILGNITDPEAIDSAIRLAGDIRWFDGDSSYDPPFGFIVSAFEGCFDSAKQVYPGMRDRAYFSARAVLQINLRARARPQDHASKYPIPTVSSHPFDNTDLDLYHVMHTLKQNLDDPRPTLDFYRMGTTYAHRLWVSNLFVDLAHVGPKPILQFYFNATSTNHQAMVANMLLMWYMFLGGHIEEETVWAVDKSDSLETILSHLSTRVMDAFANRNHVPYLIMLLDFLSTWKERPACLTPMAYEWCSVFSEVTEGLGQDSMRISEFRYRDHWFGLDMELAHAEPGPDLVHPDDNSHARGRPLGLDHKECADLLLRTLEVGFRLADISDRQLPLDLKHTSHHDQIFEAVFSSGDDEAIADAVGAWIVGESSPPSSCAPYFAMRLTRATPLSPRLRRAGIRALVNNRSTISIPDALYLLNCLHVDVDDVVETDYVWSLWSWLLMRVIRSPTGFESLSSHYWRLLGKLTSRAIFYDRLEPRDVEVIKSLDEVEDWEKLEAWMPIVWGLRVLDPMPESMEDIRRVTLKLASQRPSALQKLENLCKSCGIWDPEACTALELILDWVRAGQSSLKSPLTPQSIHAQPLVFLPFAGDDTF